MLSRFSCFSIRSCKYGAIGVGTDIVYIPRFSRLLRKYPTELKDSKFWKIANKFMHSYEKKVLSQILIERHSHLRAVQYISGVWSIKESIYKSLSTQSDKDCLPPAQVIYTKLCYRDKDMENKPIIVIDQNSFISCGYSDFYNNHIKGTKFLLSISHDQDYLISFVCHVKTI